MMRISKANFVPLRRRRTKLVLLAIAGGLALVGGGTAVALTTQETFVYDSTIGETVPAALDGALNAAIGDPTDPTGDGGTVIGAPPTDPPPPIDTGTISPVNTDDGVPPPFPSDVQNPVNVLTMNDGTTEREIYAGADTTDGSDSFSGSIIDTSTTLADGTETGVTTVVPFAGALTITSYSGGIVTLTGSRSGYSVQYDTGTSSVTKETCPKGASCGTIQAD